MSLPSSGPDGSWVARETLLGRISTLSRPRRALLVTAVAVTLCCFVGVGALLSEVPGGARGNEAAFEDDLSGRSVPTRISPSSLPGLIASPSPSPTPSRRATPTSTTVKPPPAKVSVHVETPAPSKKPAPRPSGPGYTGWAGPGCTTNVYQEYGRYHSGGGYGGGYGHHQPGYGGGWYDLPSGGYRGSTCDGRFTAIPMSGHPYEDGQGTAIWSWQIGKGYDECHLAVYVPNSGRDGDAAGNPTVYQVLASASSGHYPQATFGVRQIDHRGSLVAVGSYPVEGESFTVRLLDRGQASWGAHHAAAQMRLRCTT
ncbi:adhesin [Streptomyces sp. ISL-100]|uniref:adhesin n=1 Tax=Streptomyces sp. ISL-100 TaxID=2819173 RepID=UPI0020355A5F|nr:adhesin [Streptomyces sp. ISL-100]